MIYNHVDMLPATDASIDLGSTSARFAEVHAVEVIASNLAVGNNTPTYELEIVATEAGGSNNIIGRLVSTATDSKGSTIVRIENSSAGIDIEANSASSTGWRYGTYGDAIISSTALLPGAYGSIQMVTGSNTVTPIPRLTVGAGSLVGKVGINATSPGAALQVTPIAVATVGILSKGMSSQTGALFEARNSSGSILYQVTKDGSIVVNEQGEDADSRIEGDTDANLIYVDAGADRVGIGTATPGVKFDVMNKSGHKIGRASCRERVCLLV